MKTILLVMLLAYINISEVDGTDLIIVDNGGQTSTCVETMIRVRC